MDNLSTFEELLRKDKSVSVHHRNIQFLATEMFKVKLELAPKFMTDIFNKTFGITKTKYIESVEDDPKIRKPDISRAKKILNWEPRTNIKDGLEQTYNYFKNTI